MSLHRLRSLAWVCLAIPLVSYCQFTPAKNFRAGIQNDSAWINFSPAGEEFAVSVPGNPTARTYPVSNPRDNKNEKILAHHEYSGYGSGLIFIIQSFKAEQPERVSNGILNLIAKGTTIERDIFIDGVATQRNLEDGNQPAWILYATQREIYYRQAPLSNYARNIGGDESGG